ncbi:MAG: lectin like domain-containing protein, partial [Bacteroidota bacterium]
MNRVPRIRMLVLICLAHMAAAGAAFAATPEKAPVSAQFKEYLLLKAANRWPLKTASGHPLGYRPSPHGPIAPVGKFNFFPLFERKQRFAASYDLRAVPGKLSPIRNQGPAGTCWSFACFGSMESCLRPGEPQDFSENNLKNKSGFDFGWNGGGNVSMSTAYLARWAGPLLEIQDPYDPYTGTSSPTGIGPSKHAQDVIFLPTRAIGNAADNDAIKSALLAYGGIAVSYRHQDACYDATHCSYYDPAATAETVNHEVTIVGWDDNYPASNFAASAGNPPGSGAFIVRNSWGTDWGESGYYYVSYYDGAFGRGDLAVFTSPQPTDNYLGQAGYDPLGWVNSINTPWAENVFPAPGAACSVRAVGVYAVAPGVPYEVRVYRNPVSGNGGTLAGTTTGTLPNAGYCTIPLASVVNLAATDTYAIRVRMTGPTYPSAIEYAWSGYSGSATAAAGQSYYSMDGTTYTDLTTFDPTANYCIKSFTGPVGVPAPQIAMSVNNGAATTSSNAVTLSLSL